MLFPNRAPADIGRHDKLQFTKYDLCPTAESFGTRCRDLNVERIHGPCIRHRIGFVSFYMQLSGGPDLAIDYVPKSKIQSGQDRGAT